jgi:dolichol-phosphate mannosyltransferase
MRPLEPDSVLALMTCHVRSPAEALLAALCAQLPAVLVVDDGMDAAAAHELDVLAATHGARVLHVPRRTGKGSAIAAGIRFARGARLAGRGLVVMDGDGQHPPEAIPAFLDASAVGELVVGNRFAAGGDAAMPFVRRVSNRAASAVLSLSTGAAVPDSQCGMRLLHGRALERIEFPPGGMDSETRHLRRCLRFGLPVAWVAIPAVYDGAPSSFRPVRDSVAVMRAAIGG